MRTDSTAMLGSRKPNGILILLMLFLCTHSISSYSQVSIDSIFGKLDPQKYAAAVGDKAKKLEEKVVAESMKTLEKVQRQEERIYLKLLKTKDSLTAIAKIDDLRSKYATLIEKLKNPVTIPGSTYLPKLDSLSTSLKFLDANAIGGSVKTALMKATALQDKFHQAEQIKKFIRERKEQLKQQLEKLGMVKHLKKINKEVYYYAAQVKEYKDILNDPKKIEKKALELLSKTKLFKDFMKQNSMLASLFRIPGDDPANQASFAGLQTRVQVNGLIQQQIAAGGPNARQQFQQNLQAAQTQLNELKNKVGKFGGSSSADEMPEGFKPNSEKTKSFLKRLDIGTNIQTQKATNFFPTVSDLAMNVGYKLNDKSVIGIGASYKLGWGRGWNNIKLTSEGVGLRSYVDWKLKGSLWISGGFEMNWKTAFNIVEQLRDLSAWQRSGLIGISKSVTVKSKFFKKTKLQLLWDFLSYEQKPRTQPVVFRINYTFK